MISQPQTFKRLTWDPFIFLNFFVVGTDSKDGTEKWKSSHIWMEHKAAVHQLKNWDSRATDHAHYGLASGIQFC